MKTVNLICIGCPMGCELQAEAEGGEVLSVKGNLCPNGERYAGKEVTAPARTVTSTVTVLGGTAARVPCKTTGEIPKEKIFDCVEELAGLTVAAPVKIGDVIKENAAGTGVNIIATKNVPCAPSV